MIWIFTDGRPSHGAALLCKEPGFKRYRKPIAIGTDLCVNWGAKHEPQAFALNLFNHPKFVARAANKLDAFLQMGPDGVKCVPFVEPINHDVLSQWQQEGAVIVGRQTLTGHSGHGIIIMEKGEPLQPALLYTRYIPKVREYRVHVVNGEVIDTQKKVRDPHKEPLSWKIRSHDNGFIFTRNNVVPSKKRDVLACCACVSLALDFGAVDIIEDKAGEFYVLEVNTAPGIEGQTVTNYAAAFRELGNG